ncbi:unnamed protein product [Arabidopsis lyrata]|nr:unnamed protein product [Arabidopsis lyrata]
MSWVSWDKLSLPKQEAGPSFRETESFNDALLAKISWRILQNQTLFWDKFSSANTLLQYPLWTALCRQTFTWRVWKCFAKDWDG